MRNEEANNLTSCTVVGEFQRQTKERLEKEKSI